MASFHDPLDAVRAAVQMLAQIRRFNDAAGEKLIGLKIDLSGTGPLLAGMRCEPGTVRVTGIEREIALHTLRASPSAARGREAG
jgi:hypothetical protein